MSDDDRSQIERLLDGWKPEGYDGRLSRLTLGEHAAIHRLRAAIDAAERRVAEAEAGAVVLREALEACRVWHKSDAGAKALAVIQAAQEFVVKQSLEAHIRLVDALAALDGKDGAA